MTITAIDREAMCGKPLTDKEDEVLKRVVKGETNKEIAAYFGRSEETVKGHVQNILAKLGVSNRLKLMLWVFHNRPEWIQKPATELASGPA